MSKKKKYNYKIIIIVLHDFLDRLFPPIVRHARKKFPSSSKLSVSPSRKERKIRAELVSIQRRTRRRNSNLTKAFTSLPRASTHHHPSAERRVDGKVFNGITLDGCGRVLGFTELRLFSTLPDRSVSTFHRHKLADTEFH